MSIANLCAECQLSAFATNLVDIEIIAKNVSSNFIELCNDSFKSTPFTSKITNVDWSSDVDMLTFRKSSSLLTQLECEEIITSKFAKDYGIPETELSKQ